MVLPRKCYSVVPHPAHDLQTGTGKLVSDYFCLGIAGSVQPVETPMYALLLA